MYTTLERKNWVSFIELTDLTYNHNHYMAKQKSAYQIQSGDWVKYKKKEAVVVCEVTWTNGEKFIIELKNLRLLEKTPTP